ncbi:MAG: hypothetical protein V8Q79_02435 [Christensenellales bacterium]
MKKLITVWYSPSDFCGVCSPILADGASVVLNMTEMQRYEMASSLAGLMIPYMCWETKAFIHGKAEARR